MKPLVIACLFLCACGTVAPTPVSSDSRAIDSKGNPTGGFWGVETVGNAKGVAVDPLLVIPNYKNWLPKYGQLCNPPATPVTDSFIKLPNGDLWCNDIVWLNYEDMRRHAQQDAKL